MSLAAMEEKPRRRSSLYTKTGDDGTSQLYTGRRVSKSDAVFHALGNGLDCDLSGQADMK